MSFGITELMIILVIILLVFGTKKLKNIGTDLGGAIKGFRSAVTETIQLPQKRNHRRRKRQLPSLLPSSRNSAQVPCSTSDFPNSSSLAS